MTTMYEELKKSPRQIKVIRHFLAHPEGSFHLHGLARLLSLPVTSLRRDLLGLTNKNILTVDTEANVKFYSLRDDLQLKEQLMKTIGIRTGLINYRTRRLVFAMSVIMVTISVIFGGTLLVRERLNYQRIMALKAEVERMRLLNELAQAKLSEERVLQAITRSREAF